MVVVFNVTMWACYTNSLRALSSLQATVTNFATDFLSSGLAGFFLFEETLSVKHNMHVVAENQCSSALNNHISAPVDIVLSLGARLKAAFLQRAPRRTPNSTVAHQ